MTQRRRLHYLTGFMSCILATLVLAVPPADAALLSLVLSSPTSMTLQPSATAHSQTSVTVTGGVPWSLTVTDQKTSNRGYMVPGDLVLASGLCTATQPLANPMTVTSSRDALDLGNPSSLVTDASLTSASGPQVATGLATTIVDLTFNQSVSATEALAKSPPCAYRISLTITTAAR